MVLSSNDEEVANSSRKHTQFKTRVHIKMAKKNHTLWRSKYLYSLYKGLPSRAKNTLQIMSLTAYASGTNKA